MLWRRSILTVICSALLVAVAPAGASPVAGPDGPTSASAAKAKKKKCKRKGKRTKKKRRCASSPAPVQPGPTDPATSPGPVFPPLQRRLTVATAGGGAGNVTSSPPGISCGADCSHDYDYGTVVTLTATADPGSAFTGWSGACSGTGACMVTVNDVKGVIATFTPTHELTVTTTGVTVGAATGSGTVLVSPAGTSCGPGCSRYPEGTGVTATASPNPGSLPVTWTLDGVPVGFATTPISFMMGADHTLNATFAPQPALGG